MPESHSSQEKSDNALRDECQGCHSGHVEPDCPAHGVDSEQARINYMSPEERDAEYRRKFGSDECEACGGRHDNCGKPDYCCAGCDKIPRSTVATLGDKVEAWAKAWQSFKKPDNCRLLYEVAAALKANDAEIERLRAFKVRAEEELRSACGDDFERVWRYVDGGIAS